MYESKGLMNIYRVTIQVTTDIVAEDDRGAVTQAVDKIKDAIGDDGVTATGSPERQMWVTGVARDSRGFMVFERPLTNSETLTVAESLVVPVKEESF